VLQRSNPADPLQWIQEHLGPILVAFFVFVLPAIQAALKARKQKAELEQRGEAPDASAGRKVWEDLLEGRGSTPPPLPRPEPVEEESLEDTPQPAMVELPSASATESEDESEVEEYVAARERQESERQEQVAAAEYVASSPYRPDVAPRPASAVPTVTLAKPPVPGAAETWLFPTEPARDRRAALRRAIVLREVLGPPLALR